MQYLTNPGMTSSVHLKTYPKLNADRKRKVFQRRATCSTPNSGSNDSSSEGKKQSLILQKLSLHKISGYQKYCSTIASILTKTIDFEYALCVDCRVFVLFFKLPILCKKSNNSSKMSIINQKFF